jgi:hypothetical protein
MRAFTLDRRRDRSYPLAMRALILILALLAGPPAWAQSEDEIAFAKDFYNRLQMRSIIENREYCGFFFRDAGGTLHATRPDRGKSDTCQMGSPPRGVEVIASYHTHAAFSPDHMNEVPSLQDLQGDIAAGLDGYIATPGGRLWFSDHEVREVRQICGIGCLVQDPDFRPGRFYKERRRYTLDDLKWLMGE